MPDEITRLKNIIDAVEYLLELTDPSDNLYIEPIDEKDKKDPAELETYCVEMIEAMHTQIESTGKLVRVKP